MSLRVLQAEAEATQIRFETPPGRQSQIAWGESRVSFRSGVRKLHIFVLTLGFSRRSFFWGAPKEQLGAFLEAHERAFEHFGGRTREHLYDRSGPLKFSFQRPANRATDGPAKSCTFPCLGFRERSESRGLRKRR